MPIDLGKHDLDAVIFGGLVLSAGGSGMQKAERNRRIGDQALKRGPVQMVSLDELDDDSPIIVATGVGVPSHGKAVISPQDSVQSAQMLLVATGCQQPAGVMPGHVPGILAWFQAAVLGIPLVDAATNGRGHPTVAMGGMGLASRPTRMVTQAGCGGPLQDRVEIVVSGSLMRTSAIMRAASVENGGGLFATRGPFDAAMVRTGGAPGSISFAAQLGRAMLDGPGGPGLIETAASFLHGTVIASGRVERNDVSYRGGFDLGNVEIETSDSRVILHTCNEFMAADRDGIRIATFPDLLGSFDAKTGEPIAVTEMSVGREVAILFAPRKRLPIATGSIEPCVLAEVEEKLRITLSIGEREWQANGEAMTFSEFTN